MLNYGLTVHLEEAVTLSQMTQSKDDNLLNRATTDGFEANIKYFLNLFEF
jgi:hypothetical protein